jgi:antitoxin (DNA-binding transcriptional repressor) of toxin-antitoxin stability system
MNTTTLTIAEAARNLSALIRRGDRMVLIEDGRPVAEIVPIETPAVAKTCGELAKFFATYERMPVEEAELFARDIEEARRRLKPQRRRW